VNIGSSNIRNSERFSKNTARSPFRRLFGIFPEVFTKKSFRRMRGALTNLLKTHFPRSLSLLIVSYACLTLQESLDLLLPEGSLVELESSYPDPFCRMTLRRLDDELEAQVYKENVVRVSFDSFVEHVQMGHPLALFELRHVLQDDINHGLLVHLYELLNALCVC
jgi:hypothetical protein